MTDLLIRAKFEKSIDTYNTHALVQKEICSKLSELTKKYVPLPIHQITEIGCGTGMLTAHIAAHFRPTHYYLNDINTLVASKIESIIREQPHTYLFGNAEEIGLPQHNDLVISSSTVQWFKNLPKFLTSISKDLTANGYLIFSTFGKNNFKEIKTISGSGLNYYSLPELEELVSAAHYDIIHTEEEETQLLFDSPLDILKHLKYTGVTGSFSRVWTKNDLNNFSDHYRQLFSDGQKVSLTYHPIYIVAKLK